MDIPGRAQDKFKITMFRRNKNNPGKITRNVGKEYMIYI